MISFNLLTKDLLPEAVRRAIGICNEAIPIMKQRYPQGISHKRQFYVSVVNEKSLIQETKKRLGVENLIKDEFVQVYTDGSYRRRNGKCRDGARAGIGVWWGHGHKWNVSQRLGGDQSSNTAEVEAVIKAIEQAMEADIKRIQVNLDSQSVVDFVNFRFKEQKMKDDFKKLAKLLKRATNAGMEIKTNYVKGHSGVEGNVEANRLAQRYTIKLAKFKEAEIAEKS